MFKLRRLAHSGIKGSIFSLAAALAIFVSLSIPVHAAGGPWTVVSVVGDAKLIAGAGAAQLPRPGQSVTTGVTIATGADGIVVLARRGDKITVMPNSRMSVPAGIGSEEPGILQSLGKLLFRMESRESRDFDVVTPYLAVAIKGTAFTVEVDDGAALVDVAEGLVQVTALASGNAEIVGAGARAEVNKDELGTVQVGVIPEEPAEEATTIRSFDTNRDGSDGSGGGGAAGGKTR